MRTATHGTSKAQPQRLIVVLGMHRSGTSAMTRALQVMGVSLGARLMPPVAGVNDKGFWEDLDFYALNIQMLQALGRDWHHLAPCGEDFVERLCSLGFLPQAAKLLRDKMGNLPLFAFKDPRVTILLPFWQRAFALCGVDVSYVLALRNPISVAKSLARREGFDHRKGVLLWLTHVLAMFHRTAGMKRRVLVDYDRLIEQPQRELHRIATGLALEVDPAQLEEYTSSFLDSGLQHSLHSTQELAQGDFNLPVLQQIYPVLQRAACDDVQIDDPALEQIFFAAHNEFARQGTYLEILDALYEQLRAARHEMGKHGGNLFAPQRGVDVTLPSEMARFDAAAGGPTVPLHRNNVSLQDDVPVVSIIILNFRKPDLTCLSVKSALESSISVTFEIIVVDNDSTPENFQRLLSQQLPVRLLRNTANLHFGEGNNLGADLARGEFLLFLNNDAFLAPGCVDSLLQAFSVVPNCGAAGPVFRYPDGTLQEAGAFAMNDGYSWQRGKPGRTFDLKTVADFEHVDYISAACLMVRAGRFADLGGFSYRFDPAYYEDVDLCLRMKLRGESTVLAKSALCIHVENATTRDELPGARLQAVVEKNRMAFLEVWGAYLPTRLPVNLPQDLIPRLRLRGPFLPASAASAIVLDTPAFPGGALRQAMATIGVLNHFGPAALATAGKVSAIRLESLAFEMGLPPAPIKTLPVAEAATAPLERVYVMGRGVCPEIGSAAKRRFFHSLSLLPPMEKHDDADGKAREAVAALEKIFAASRFAQQALQVELQRIGAFATVEILRPAAAAERLVARERSPKPWILSIGPFCESGRSGRQDVLIDALNRTSAAFQAGWTLLLCGTVPNTPEDRAYFQRLRQNVGAQCQVQFVLSPTRRTLESLMSQSSIYADARGFGVQEPPQYWKCDGLGIALTEAMIAGCRGLSYGIGCGKEIIDECGTGATYDSADELAARLEQGEVGGLEMHQRQELAQRFGEQRFRDQLLAAVA